MAKKTMITIFFLVVIALSTANSLRFRRQFPCNHPLRISAPRYFSHCNTPCLYSDWGDWEMVPGSIRRVAESKCKSREAYTERRTRTSIGAIQSSCNVLTNDRLVCIPDAADKLILALGLAGTGQDHSQTHQPYPGHVEFSRGPNAYIIQDLRRCPHNGLNGQVCHHLTGKRSVSYVKKELSQNSENLNADIAPLEHSNEDSIMQFSYDEHAHRFRRQISPENCDSDGTQHVLFVLDSSGSIGNSSYYKMKVAIAKLTPLFCKKVKFSLMTFSSRLNLEFCFDCFENTYDGRNAAANAIKAASYQGGGTRTGEAARCICEELLSTDCGISSNPSCLDVVFITDGHSNRGGLQVCNEIRCLHHKSGVNTYAIGINGFNQAELNCIAENGSDRLSAFEFNSFAAFERAIDDVIARVYNQLGQGNPLSCAALYNDRAQVPNVIPIDPDSGIQD